MASRYTMPAFSSEEIGMTIRSICVLVRSRTLVYVFAIVSLGTFLVSSGPKLPDFILLSKLVSSVYLIALATYLYNDLTDYAVDRINKRNTVSSEPSKYRMVLCCTVLFFVVSILLAFSINLQTGFSSVGFLALAILYSHPKTHLKDRFVLKTLVTAAGGSIVSMMGYFASGNSSYLGIISSLIAFMFWFTLGPLGDVDDIKGDKANGRRTFPIVMGVRNTFLLMHSVIIGIVALIFFTYYMGEITMMGLILSISVCIFVSYTISKVSKHYHEKKVIKQTRTTLRYSLFSIQIMLLLGFVFNALILQQ